MLLENMLLIREDIKSKWNELVEYINLHKVNKWCKFLLGTVDGAAILHSFKKYMCCNRFLPEA